MKAQNNHVDRVPGNICKCGICGKTFYIEHPDMWVYKLGYQRGRTTRFCSYTCFRTAQKTGWKPKQRQVHKQKEYKPPERWYKMREMRDAGATHREIAAAFGIHETSVGSIISKLNKYERDGSPYDY